MGTAHNDDSRVALKQEGWRLSAVIPAFNEASRIGRTIREVSRFVDEVIVIDDASTDATASVASAAGAIVVSRQSNAGYVAAIKTGFQRASGDIVITFDADGEHSADDIPSLVKPIIDDTADMVQGHRDFVPRISERFLTWLAERKAAVGDSGTGLRAIRTELARSLEIKGVCICGVLSLEAVSRGARITEVPIKLNGTSKSRRVAWFHAKQLLLLVHWMLTNRFSRWELSRTIDGAGGGPTAKK